MPDTNDPTFLSPSPADAPTRDPASAGDGSLRTTDAGPSTSVGPGGPAARVPALPGYELYEELGRGGMGVVYRARQVRLDRVVAVKLLLRPDRTATEARRFEVEARAVAKMQHPNIVQVFEVGEADGRPFLTLEYVPGGTLSRKVADALLPPWAAAGLLATLARAVHYAHERGVLHRDLKPGNVLLAADGTPKVADFGLARHVETDSDLTVEGAIVGTPSYMSPEQAAGDAARVGPRSDVYSLGAVFYDLLTGRPPFKGSTVMDTLEQVRTADPTPPAKLQPGVPRDLETVCLKCLEKNPARRYPTAAALADELNRYLRGEPILARPLGPAGRFARWCRRKPREAALWLTAAGLLLGVLGVFAWSHLALRAKNAEVARANQNLEAANADLTAERDAARRMGDLNAEQVRFLLRTLSAELKALGLNTTRAKLVRQSLGYIDKMERLTTEGRGVADRGRVSAYTEIGELYLNLGATERDPAYYRRAEESYAKAVELAEGLARADPDSDLARGNLALTLDKLGRARALRGLFDGPDGAAALIDRGLALRKEIVDSPRGTPGTRAALFPADTLRSLAEAHRSRAWLADLRGRRDVALADRTAALGLLQKAYDLAKADPNTTEETLRLAAFEGGLANALLEQAAEVSARSGVEKEPKAAAAARAEAERLLERALALSARAVEDNAESVPFKADLATVLFRVGVGRLIAGKNAEARDAFERCFALRDQIVKQGAGDEAAARRHRWELSLALYGIGHTNEKLGDRKKATAAFRDCLKLREDLLREDDQLQYARGVALATARTGDHAAAAKVLDREEARQPRRATPLFLFDAAAALSHAAGAVGGWAGDDELTPADAAVRAGYVEKAWGYVRKLAAANPPKAREVATDPDFEFLRERPDFRTRFDEATAPKK